MKRISLTITLLVLISCGKSRRINSAPLTQGQAGLITTCTAVATAAQLAETHNLRYRVINEKAKLIEFYDIDKESLKKLLPNSKINQNTVYDSLVEASQFTIAATNEPYWGVQTRIERVNTDKFYFPYLEQINGFDSVNGNKGDNIVIAIVDTGVSYNHPHLSPNIKTNPAEGHGTNANSFDDDGNGVADDYVGYDFFNGDAYPIDDHGHGTHVAGLAAGTINGVAVKAKILPVKVMNANGQGDIATIAAGILYAIDSGAKIINLSLGGPKASMANSEIQQMIGTAVHANNNGSLLVVAAGNGGNDGIGDCNDKVPIYPASIESDAVLTVASVDSFGELASYSNYGPESVHVAAPGGASTTGGLLSTAPVSCPSGPCTQNNTPYQYMSGTSMASPVVAGVAALVAKERSDFNSKQLKEAIMENGQQTSELEGKVKSGSVVDVYNTITSI